MSTAFPDDFNFKTKINDEGSLEFSLKTTLWEKEINYENLTDFIQFEANQKRMLINLEEKKIQEAQAKLEKIKKEVEKQNEEYLSKQRQISTFLECKKSFLGKVKYYFSTRKKELKPINKNKPNNIEKKIEKQAKEEKVEAQTKQYTIEDLIEVCTKLEARQKMAKALKIDEKALELKQVNLERKNKKQIFI